MRASQNVRSGTSSGTTTVPYPRSIRRIRSIPLFHTSDPYVVIHIYNIFYLIYIYTYISTYIYNWYIYTHIFLRIYNLCRWVRRMRRMWLRDCLQQSAWCDRCRAQRDQKSSLLLVKIACRCTRPIVTLFSFITGSFITLPYHIHHTLFLTKF